MKPRRDYTFNSSLAPAIEGLIREKRTSGYMYNSNADVLKELDTFCIENGFGSETVTKDLSDAWAVQRDTEGISARNIRVSNLRQVSKYLLSIGTESYIPKMLQSTETKIAHVFSPEERKEFFEYLNKLKIKRQDNRLLEGLHKRAAIGILCLSERSRQLSSYMQCKAGGHQDICSVCIG